MMHTHPLGSTSWHHHSWDKGYLQCFVLTPDNSGWAGIERSTSINCPITSYCIVILMAGEIADEGGRCAEVMCPWPQRSRCLLQYLPAWCKLLFHCTCQANAPQSYLPDNCSEQMGHNRTAWRKDLTFKADCFSQDASLHAWFLK